MIRIPITFKNIIASIVVLISFSTFASELPDPEVLAKQYLKDLCTLSEQDFTRKYMLTQADAEFVIEEITTSYKKMNKAPTQKISDSLVLRGEIHRMVVASYRSFKEWQHENEIDSSKVVYAFCEFELNKIRKIPFYTLSEATIYFTVDTSHYVFPVEEFVFLQSKWIGGDANEIYSADKYFNVDYGYDDYGYAVDTAVAVDAYDYQDYSEVEETEVAYSKKDLKLQKKIDAYNRKIDALYMKKHA